MTIKNSVGESFTEDKDGDFPQSYWRGPILASGFNKKKEAMTSEAMQAWYEDCNVAMGKFWDDWFNDFTQQKEKIMNNEEAAKELEVLRNKIKDIEEGLLMGDGPWRAEGQLYYTIGNGGAIGLLLDNADDSDDARHLAGNYFQTEEDAVASLIYKALNDKWHYWVAGVNEKPEAVPNGCEVFSSHGDKWETDVNDRTFVWNNNPRRWPKH